MRKFRVPMALLLTITLLLSMFSGFALGAEENVFSSEEVIEMESGTESVEDGTAEELPEETLPGEELSEPTLSEENAANFKLPDIEQLLGPSDATYVDRLEEAEDDIYTFVFLNEDGTRTKRLYSHPVKYTDENGSVRDITTDIKVLENGAFQTKDNAILTTFAKHLTDGITLAHEEISIKMTPQLPATTGSLTTSPMQIGSLSEDFKTVSYPYMDKTTLEYELTYTGFKEDIVVSEYTGQTEYSFLLSTGGLYLHEEEGSYYLIDEDEIVRATIGDIIIFTADECNNTFGSMSAVTIRAGQEYLLTIHVDAEYLADEATAYPIRIDPTIEVNYDNDGSGAIQDVTINSNGGSSGTSGSLFVGLRESSGIARILMRFPGLDLSDVASASNITTAYVEIRDVMCESTAMAVSCYAFTGNAWEESTANWSNVSPNSYSTLLSSNTISYSNGTSQTTAHRYRFDIKTVVKAWKTGTFYQDRGILFRASSDVETGNTYIHKTFASYNRASYKPSLTVTYALDNSISMSASSIAIQEGSTKALTATTNPSGSAVTWTSSNTTIATVNSAGVVTGKKAGQATITATMTDSSNVQHTAQCTVYVYIADGVYYIQNKYSELYLNVQNGLILEQTNVQQFAKYDSMQVNYLLRQQWKIKHLGSGYYSVRPMHKLDMGLEVTGNNADVDYIGTTDSLSGVSTAARWKIEYTSKGYVFKKNGSSSYALQVEENTSSSGANVVATTYSSSYLRCHWGFEKIDSPNTKILVYYTSTGSLVTAPTNAIVVGNTRTLAQLNLTVAVSSPLTNSQTVTWESSDTTIASVNSSTGAVTTEKEGTVTIVAKKQINGTTYVASTVLKVIPFVDGTYYIKNVQHGKFAQLDAGAEDKTSFGVSIEQWTFGASTEQKWILTSMNNGYYKIMSAKSGLVLSVPAGSEATENITLVQETYSASSQIRQQWKVYQTANGSYCIKSRTADLNNVNLVMCVATGEVDGTTIQQRTYEDNTSYKDEWYVHRVGTNVAMLGVPSSSEHDHVSPFGSYMTILSEGGHEGFNVIYQDSVTLGAAINALAQSDIFISRSHGEGDEEDKTSWIYLYNEVVTTGSVLSSEDLYDYTTNTAKVNLSGVTLVMFVGCQTGYGGAGAPNLVNAAHDAGADFAVGFKMRVDCTAASKWAEYFCMYFANGYSVADAADMAQEASDDLYADIDPDNRIERNTSSYYYTLQ